jgi:hypothetical protein
MTTAAEQSAQEIAEQTRSDRAADAADAAEQRARLSAGLRAALEDRRAPRIGPDALLKRARDAARLEVRGVAYSAEDRADIAAAIVADVIAELGPSPRADSERVTLTAFCGRAKTLRRSLDRQRARDAADAAQSAHTYAQSASALDPHGKRGAIPARLLELAASRDARAAERATAAALQTLGLSAADHPADSPVWIALYQWTRGGTSEQTARERGMSAVLVRKRQMIGAKFLRGFYSADALASRFTLGAARVADGIVYVCEDRSQEAHGRTPLLADVPSAPHWREGTAAGQRAERAESADAAREACRVSRTRVRPKRERDRARGTAAEQRQRRADALAAIARDYARAARREPAVSDGRNGRTRDGLTAARTPYGRAIDGRQNSAQSSGNGRQT